MTVLEELYVKERHVPRRHLNAFRNAMNLREAADYGMTYSDDGARSILSDAGSFLEVVDKVLGSPVDGA